MAPRGLVTKTLDVIRAVAGSPDGIGLSELSRATSIPKATCMRILTELETESIVVPSERTKRYRLALGAVALGGDLLSSPGAGFRGLRSELVRLASATGETAGVDLLHNESVLVVMEVPGPQMIGQRNAKVPREIPTWCTSTGKVLLAGLSDVEIRAQHGEALKRYQETENRSYGDLVSELRAVRELGFATARDEMSEGAAALAAPVVVRGEVVAAVWIGGPSFRLTSDRMVELAPLVRAAADLAATWLSASGAQLTSGVTG